MIGYIYYITNDINGKVYVGKTCDIQHRIESHMSALKLGKHHSHKLQRAVNKYGIEHFKVTYELCEVANEEELSILEMQEIAKCNAYEDGYNETLGGEGHKKSLSFDDSVLVYHILQRYKGVNRLIARYYECDHTVIDQLGRNNIYAQIDYNQDDLDKLISILGLTDKNLAENYRPHNSRKLTRETCLELLSVIKQKTRYDKTMCEIFNIDSKLTYRLKNGLIYQEYIKEYDNLSNEAQKDLLQHTLEKYHVEEVKKRRAKPSVRKNGQGLTQEQVNYIMDNKDNKTRVQIGAELGISTDRVSGVILGKYYKDLVVNYYSSKQ